MFCSFFVYLKKCYFFNAHVISSNASLILAAVFEIKKIHFSVLFYKTSDDNYHRCMLIQSPPAGGARAQTSENTVRQIKQVSIFMFHFSDTIMLLYPPGFCRAALWFIST